MESSHLIINDIIYPQKVSRIWFNVRFKLPGNEHDSGNAAVPPRGRGCVLGSSSYSGDDNALRIL